MTDENKRAFEALKNFAAEARKPDNFLEIIAQLEENKPASHVEGLDKPTQDAITQITDNFRRQNLNDQILNNITKQQEEIKRVMTLP